MYAIVQAGGRQFRAEPEAKIRIPKVEVPVGETLELDQVLLVQDETGLRVGRPLVEGAKVVAEVLEQGREDKILVFHKKRRKRYQKMNGHRQPFTAIRIKEIVA